MRSAILVILVMLIDAPPPFISREWFTSAISVSDADRILDCKQSEAGGNQLISCCLSVRLIHVKLVCIKNTALPGAKSLLLTLTFGDEELLTQDKPIGKFCGNVPRMKPVSMCVQTLKSEAVSADITTATYEGCLWLKVTMKVEFKLICYEYNKGNVILQEDKENEDFVVYDKSIDGLLLDLSIPVERLIKTILHPQRRGALLDASLGFFKQKSELLKGKLDQARQKANLLIEKGIQKGEQLHDKGEQLYYQGKKIYGVGEGVFNRSKDAYFSSRKTAKSIKEAFLGMKAESGKLKEKTKQIFTPIRK